MISSLECNGMLFGMAWSNDALSDDNDDSRLLMPAGMFFVVIGGWFLSR